MVINFTKYRKNRLCSKYRLAFREIGEYYEYQILSGYDDSFTPANLESIQVNDVRAILIESERRFVFVAIWFPKNQFDLEKAIEWLQRHGLSFQSHDASEFYVDGADEIVWTVNFNGNHLVKYTRGNRRIQYDPTDFFEITDPDSPPKTWECNLDDAEYIENPLSTEDEKP